MFSLLPLVIILAMNGGVTSHQITTETSGRWEKWPGNPVLGGNLGTCFDISVLKEGAIFRMWFSWRPKNSIAVVESKDGIHWSKPVIVLGPNEQSGWEYVVNRPVVIRKGNRYLMWYTGQANGHSAIGFADSSDGVHWNRLSAKPVLSPDSKWEGVALMCPDVLWDTKANEYKMWYSGGEQSEPNAIGYAVSKDGLNWKRHVGNPIFRPAKKNKWEQDRVTACQVIKDNGCYIMFYIGFEDVSYAQIGLARSRNGVTDWQRFKNNPIIWSRRFPHDWDFDAVYKPYTIFDKNRWLLWYNGRKGDREQIGLAIHEGRELFKEHHHEK